MGYIKLDQDVQKIKWRYPACFHSQLPQDCRQSIKSCTENRTKICFSHGVSIWQAILLCFQKLYDSHLNRYHYYLHRKKIFLIAHTFGHAIKFIFMVRRVSMRVNTVCQEFYFVCLTWFACFFRDFIFYYYFLKDFIHFISYYFFFDGLYSLFTNWYIFNSFSRFFFFRNCQFFQQATTILQVRLRPKIYILPVAVPITTIITSAHPLAITTPLL